jgi:RND superfamily putative drug exporter
MLERLASFLHRNRRRVLPVALVSIVTAGAFGLSVTNRMSPYGDADPSTQSVQATDRFEKATDRQISPGVVALVAVRNVQGASDEQRVRQVEAELRSSDGIAAASSYYDTHDSAMVSRDGKSTYVVGYFRHASDATHQTQASALEKKFAGRKDVKLGGGAIADDQVDKQVGNDLARAELFAFPLIFLLSLIFFRSLVASLLPPFLGVLSILVTFFALRVVSGFTSLSVFALNLVTGLGLGLAIDYSLFMVSRYREESAKFGYGSEALRRTLATAGRTIMFSSVTVAAALASLTIFPQLFLFSMGLAGAIVALVAAAVALVVLPTMLALLGPRVNAVAPKRLQRAAAREARPAESGFWFRLSQAVIARPRTIAIATTLVLVAVGMPFTSVKFLPADANTLPATATAHMVDHSLRTQFPAGRTSPVEVVVAAPARSSQAVGLAGRIRSLPDVAAVSRPLAAGPDLSSIEVSPSSSTYDAASRRLVHSLRSLKEPFYVGVTGDTAGYVDLEHSLGDHLPLVLGLVVTSTLIVLLMMTGSLVLGVKGVLMNALSLAAVFGLLVLIFQDGHLQGLLSFTSTGALDSTQPILLFAIGFALATDYGVFLLARIKEAHDSGLPNDRAVAIGLERTGRITTAAALLFAVAIGAFVTSKLVFIKELGFGSALAVLIDASIIRALLVPALMGILGTWNWWAPAPLRRLRTRLTLLSSES